MPVWVNILHHLPNLCCSGFKARYRLKLSDNYFHTFFLGNLIRCGVSTLITDATR